MSINTEQIISGLIPADGFPQEKNHWNGHAAVLVPLKMTDQGFSLLLTKRAQALSHHGGEVAFPGGMWELGDHFPVSTALRESKEEVALEPRHTEVLGLLPDLFTRRKVLVTPVVAVVADEDHLVPSPDEIESIFWMPMTELLADQRVRTDVFHHHNHALWAPVYHYQGYEIWGFTAGVIVMLMNRCFNADLKRDHHAPEKIWRVD